MKINSIDKDIKSLLSANYYRIPRFQRPYSWDRENISEFWNDIIVDCEGEYFIGSMVVFKLNSETYGVVDGQQRLTTITMILCALRDAFKKEKLEHLARGIHSLIERKNIDDKLRFILTTETSYPYFQEYIQKFGEPTLKVDVGEEEKNLEDTNNLINAYIDEAIQSIKNDTTLSSKKKQELIKDKLILIRDSILNLKIIFIELDDEDDAYIIFETLNTRGKELSVTDLVRNLVTKYIKPKATDTTKIQWEKIISTIEGSSADLSVDTFLHHYWLSKYDFVTLKKVFKKIKEQINKNKAQGFLNELEIDATTYREIHEAASRKWAIEEQEIKGSLDALSIFRVKQQVPVVLALMREYKAKKLKLQHVRIMLSAIEKFHFIFTAVTSQRSSGGISLMYASAAKKLSNAKTDNEKLKVLKELKNKIQERIPTMDEFLANFGEIIFTNNITKQKKLVQYILSKIDSYFQKAYTIDYGSMTIEHILPQSHKVKEAVVGQLGNLIFVNKDLNEKLKDKPFTQKIALLKRNKTVLDDILENASMWGKDEINKRTKLLGKIAYKQVWKI